eukprot:433816-Heterocapsa_arctica.AAC.1
MKAVEVCHPCRGKVNKVYIDESATKVGASCYAGWGLWTPDDHLFHECGPLLGEEQGSDRAEVTALVAALEQLEDAIEYVRDTAQCLAAGGLVHKGKHSDLWSRIKLHIGKLGLIRWVKAHWKEEKASAAGVNYNDWFGNKHAYFKAKEGAEKHGYTVSQKKTVTEHVYLAQRVQDHMIRTYKKYIINPLVRKDI